MWWLDDVKKQLNRSGSWRRALPLIAVGVVLAVGVNVPPGTASPAMPDAVDAAAGELPATDPEKTSDGAGGVTPSPTEPSDAGTPTESATPTGTEPVLPEASAIEEVAATDTVDGEAADAPNEASGAASEAVEAPPATGAVDAVDPTGDPALRAADDPVITVSAGGDRTGGSTAAGLAGVVFDFYQGHQNDASPQGTPVAWCETQASGTCSVSVRPLTGGGGNPPGYWVVLREAPLGWYASQQLDVGSTQNYRFFTGNVTPNDTVVIPPVSVEPVMSASGGLWQVSRDNPDLPNRCGLKLAVLVDLSAANAPNIEGLRSVGTELVDGLVGTPTSMAVFTFAGSAPASGTTSHPLTSLADASGAAAIGSYFQSLNGVNEGSNWDSGLWQIASAAADYDVVMVLVGGNPTHYGPNQGGTGTTTQFREIENAVFSANAIKNAGAKVIAVDLGGASTVNLRAISGPDSGDYITSSFDQLGPQLADMVGSACDGTVTVVKKVIAPGGTVADATLAGGWTFTTSSAGVTPTSGVTDADSGATTFVVPGEMQGEVSFNETSQPDHVIAPQDGKNAVCTAGGNPVTVTNQGENGFAIAATPNERVTCVVYNQKTAREATVQVDKAWVIDGEPYVDGAQPDAFDARLQLTGQSNPSFGTTYTGYHEGDQVTVDETYTVPPGCQVSKAGAGIETLAEGANSFIITNTVTCVSTLTLVKDVTNDNGGTAVPVDFELTATGPSVISGVTGDPAVTGANVEAGTYTISETGPTGYAWTNLECRNANEDPVEVSDDHELAIAAGDDITCTLTNDDLPATLTLEKVVDPGGAGAHVAEPSAWILTADGPTSISGATGEDAITNATVDAGAYILSESGPDGYEAGEWQCVGGTVEGSTVQVPSGTDVTCTIINTAITPKLTLVKDVVNDNGGTAEPGDFELTATGPSVIFGVTGDPAITAASVQAGEYTISETGPTGYEWWNLECRTADNGPVEVSDDHELAIAAGDDITCTLTNDDLPATLTLEKVVDPGGAGAHVAEPSAWTLTAVNGSTTVTGPSGDPSVTGVSVPAGSYTLSEYGPAGYEPGFWECSGGVVTDATVFVPNGGEVICRITNTAITPQLTLVKEVTNDNGGTAVPVDFELTATGPSVISGVTGDPAVTGANVEAGQYTVSETGPTGYEWTNLECRTANDDPVTVDDRELAIVAGDDITCTLTNDDLPGHLTLIKTVEGPAEAGTLDPATAWTLTADGPTTISGAMGDEAVTNATVDAGAYDLSESGPSGYEAGQWQCVGGTVEGSTVQVPSGMDVTCTIVNTAIPAQLTLVKEVVNDNGGTRDASDWTLAAIGPTAISGVTGTASVTARQVPAGLYVIGEATLAGYEWTDLTCVKGEGDPVAVGPDRAISLALADKVTCTLTNDDLPALLTLKKIVDPGGAGDQVAEPSEWTLTAVSGSTTVTGPSDDPSVTGVSVPAGSYTLSEDGPSGYDPGFWECTGGVVADATVFVPNGGEVICRITNTAITPLLTLVKDVRNDNGGTATPVDFELTATGPSVISGATGDPSVTGANVEAGTYAISESGPTGYEWTNLECRTADGGPVTVDDHALAIAAGDDITCTLTNEDLPATLTLVKVVDPGGAGAHVAEASEWTLIADGPTPISGATGEDAVTNVTVDAGAYDLSESGPGGYAAGQWQCVGGTVEGSTVQVPSGTDVTCTIINAAITPKLTLVKDVVNDNGGTAEPGDFELTATGPSVISGVTGDLAVTAASVEAGTYTVSETGPAGYEWTDVSCVNRGGGPVTVVDHELAVAAGDDITCTLTNEDLPATLTLEKIVDPGETGAHVAEASEWTLTANGPKLISGPSGDPSVTGVLVPAGSYALSEYGPAGYEPGFWECSGAVVDGSTVSVPNGGTVICRITNTAITPLLTLVKDVVNDNGGTAEPGDFELTATGPSVISGVTGDPAVTGANVEAGQYTISETGPTGYEWTDLTCVNGEGGPLVVVDHELAIAAGDDITCTLTNDDQPGHLTLIKTVEGPAEAGTLDPATAWTLTADGPTTISGLTGDGAITNATVDAGAYGLSESGPSGYAAGQWQCTGGSVEGSTVQVPSGTDVTCTIVNTAIPAELTLVKEVVNDNGGTRDASEWTLAAIGPTAISGVTGTASVTARQVPAGLYVIGESTFPGYDWTDLTCATSAGSPVAVGPDKTILLALADKVTCTLTSNDLPGLLTLEKIVDPGGAGDQVAEPSEWTLIAYGPTPISGPSGEEAITNATVDAGSYDLYESGPAGYEPGFWECTGGVVTDATVFVPNGGEVICQITNTAITPLLTLVKDVVNDNGGMRDASEWTLTATGPSVTSGVTGDPAVTSASVEAGTYTVSETGPAGYEWTDVSCVNRGGGPVTVVDHDLAIAAGDDITCTLTNDDVAGSLQLVKNVAGNEETGGTATADDWHLSATLGEDVVVEGNGSTPVTTVDAGQYGLAETSNDDVATDGYLAGDWTCSAGDLTIPVAQGQVDVPLGMDVVCSITNTAIPAELTLVKDVVNDNGGTRDASEWTLAAIGPTAISGVTGTASVTARQVPAGLYVIGESTFPGYDWTNLTCVTSAGNPVAVGPDKTISLALADKVACTLTNNDLPGLLTLEKIVDPGGAGDQVAEPSEWTLTAVGGSTTVTGPSGDPSVTGVLVPAGSYALSEYGPAGYEPGFWECTGGTVEGSTVSVPNGGVVVCRITNTAITPKLTLVKDVVNDNGGTATPVDFELTATGPSVISGVTGDLAVTAASVQAGEYTISESGPAGYVFAGVQCHLVDSLEQVAVENNTLAIAAGDDITCTLTNDDVAGSLQLVKNVAGNEETGGTATADDWHLSATLGEDVVVEGNGSTPVTTVDAGQYGLAETSNDDVATDGYLAGDWTCSAGDLTIPVAQGQVDVPLGMDVVCSITNTAQPSQWHVVKTADPASGSTVLPGSQITYTITVTHDGGVAPVDVTITDDLSQVLPYADLVGDDPFTTTSGSAELSGTDVVWTTDTVTDTATLTYTATVRPEAWDSALSNVVTGSGLVPPTDCPAPSPERSSVAAAAEPPCGTTHTVPKLPTLRLLKIVDNGDVARAGEPADWRLIADPVEIVGQNQLTGLGEVPTVDVQPGQYQLAEEPATEIAQTGFHAGQWQCVNLVPPQGGEGQPTEEPIEVTEGSVSLDFGQNVLCRIVNVAYSVDLAVEKTSWNPGAAAPGGVVASPGIGQRFHYRLDITNAGYGPATGVSVTDVFPASLIVDESTITAPPGWTIVLDGRAADGSGGTLTAYYEGVLDVGASAVIVVPVTVGIIDQPDPTAAIPDIKHAACAVSAEADSNPTNNCGAITVPVTSTVVSVTTACRNDIPWLGYSITAVNHAPIAFTVQWWNPAVWNNGNPTGRPSSETAIPLDQLAGSILWPAGDAWPSAIVRVVSNPPVATDTVYGPVQVHCGPPAADPEPPGPRQGAKLTKPMSAADPAGQRAGLSATGISANIAVAVGVPLLLAGLAALAASRRRGGARRLAVGRSSGRYHRSR